MLSQLPTPCPTADRTPGLDLLVEDLVVRGDDRRPLVQITHLAIKPGTAAVLRGPSGAGKSTLLLALAGVIPVASGRIVWGGTDIAALPDSARGAFRRQHIGMIFQDHLLFEELAAQANAALACLWAPRTSRPVVAAQAAGLLRKLQVAADSGRQAGTYSGGERQRIAVARALATDPPVIAADEPTASLDRTQADRLAAELIGLARDQGRMLIAVSHDPAFHAAADRVIDLHDGQIVNEAMDA